MVITKNTQEIVLKTLKNNKNEKTPFDIGVFYHDKNEILGSANNYISLSDFINTINIRNKSIIFSNRLLLELYADELYYFDDEDVFYNVTNPEELG